MNKKRIVIVIYLVGFVASVATPVVARPVEDPAAAFAAGKALLAKADFDGALEAFRTAAKTNTKNQEYAQQYAMLRQVIRLRKDCLKERDAERRLKMAAALRTSR